MLVWLMNQEDLNARWRPILGKKLKGSSYRDQDILQNEGSNDDEDLVGVMGRGAVARMVKGVLRKPQLELSEQGDVKISEHYLRFSNSIEPMDFAPWEQLLLFEHSYNMCLWMESVWIGVRPCKPQRILLRKRKASASLR